MKILAWTFGIIFGAAAAFGILQWLASERVEVVELHTTSDTGESKITRLWVVDHEGYGYLRAGEGSGWYTRLQSRPEIVLERNGKLTDYLAVANRHKSKTINRLMKEKYGWGDDFFELIMDRSDAIAVELQPR